MTKPEAKRIATVTGSGGSIGQVICELLLNEGYRVYGLDQSNSLTHSHFTYLNVDLMQCATLPSLFANDIEVGDENLLVNCAGFREIMPIADLSIEMWNKVLAVNLTAPFVLSRTFGQAVIASGTTGSIVNIASVAGIFGEPERTAYVVSKTGLIGLTKQLAIEFGKAGIRANAISPGVTRTNMTEQYFDDPDKVAMIHSGLCLNQIGTPNDIAAMVTYLASNNAGFVTGANFVIDGGWTVVKNL